MVGSGQNGKTAISSQNGETANSGQKAKMTADGQMAKRLLVAVMPQPYSNFFYVSLNFQRSKDHDVETSQNTFLGCRVPYEIFFQQPLKFSKQLYI